MNALLAKPLASSAPPRRTPRHRQPDAFELTAHDFELICELIHEHAGISLGANKRSMVSSRLARRLRDTGHSSFASYVRWVEGEAGRPESTEWQHFINSLTTNLTAFFREQHHFDALAGDLRAHAADPDRRAEPISIWCNAVSTGEEAYSVAMTAAAALGARSTVKILASDIDTQVLTAAQRGVYKSDATGLTPERLRQHFLRGTGCNEGYVRVRPDLAATITFKNFNLVDSRWSLDKSFDIVFCRNVMIYFDADTQRRVLEQMHGAIRPGGLLYVGHSENFASARDLFRLRGQTVYERV